MEVTNEIKQIANDLLERYKASIRDNGHTASGDLERTASYKVEFNGRWLEISFNLQSYWKYLENGTRPHFPPMDAIERWIQVKRIIPRTNSGRVPSTRQLAYLICREISINGTKPTKMLQQTIDSADDLITLLIDELGRQLQEEINNTEAL
jgi:hypothetical protein